MTPDPYADPEHKNYIFFGHGWSIPGYIDLNVNNKITVISLRDETFLTETRGTNIMTSIRAVKSVKDYYNFMLTYTENTGNELCVYSSDSYRRVPNMLLSTGKIKKSNELTGFFDITDSESGGSIAVQTLQELLITLGNNFTIIIFACRGPLKIEDIRWMDDIEGYFMNDTDIVNYINRKNIPIGTKTKQTKSLCQSFAKWLRSDSITAKNKRRNEYKKEQKKQKQLEYRNKKLNNFVTVEPLQSSSNAWRPSRTYIDEDMWQEDKYDLEYGEPDFLAEWNEPDYFENELDYEIDRF